MDKSIIEKIPLPLLFLNSPYSKLDQPFTKKNVCKAYYCTRGGYLIYLSCCLNLAGIAGLILLN